MGPSIRNAYLLMYVMAAIMHTVAISTIMVLDNSNAVKFAVATLLKNRLGRST